MRTETDNDDEDGAHRTPVLQADEAATVDEPPPRSAEPWRRAAVAWTQHAEAWAARTEAEAPVQEIWIPPTEPARGLAPPPAHVRQQRRPVRRTPVRRTLVPLAGAAAFVFCLASAGWVIRDWSRPEPMPLGAPPPPVVSAPALPSAPVPVLVHTVIPQESPVRPADALANWAAALRRLDIPPVALQAYGYADAVIAEKKPRCRLSWTLLAGIGAVESNHGRYGGATLRPDGTSSRPIIGVPLAGIGVDLARDTDQATLDGDREHDRAVGPMQFLPGTWRRWSVDGDGNGRADPYDIDDAALAAGYYLCAGGRNLASGSGWSSAVFSYDRVPEYVERVYQFADAYGRAS